MTFMFQMKKEVTFVENQVPLWEINKTLWLDSISFPGRQEDMGPLPFH